MCNSRLVSGDEFEVVGGRDVVVSLHFEEDSSRHVDHRALHHGEHHGQLGLQLILRRQTADKTVNKQ